MKKIQNLFLVALLAACSTVSVNAMEERVEWPQREEAKSALEAFDYQKCEGLYRSALKDKRFKDQALTDLKESVEERLDPFGAFHFVRGVLYNSESSTNKENTDLALKYLIISSFRTMLDIKVCELVYFKKNSYANKLSLLFKRFAQLFEDKKVRSLAQYRTYKKAFDDALQLIKNVNVHNYAPSFWVTSVNSSSFWYTFYFYNPTGPLAREINSNKSDSDLLKKDLNKKFSVGSLLLNVFSKIEYWVELFRLSTDTLPVVEDPSFDPKQIKSFGLSPQGIVLHTKEEEYSHEDGDELTGENDLNDHEDTDSIEVAVPTPIEENSRVVPVLDAVNLGELDGEEERAIEEALDMLRDEASTNPPAQTQQPVEEEMLALEDTGKLPAPVQAAPAPSSSELVRQEVVPMDTEEQVDASTPVATGNESEDQFVINAVVEGATVVKADVVEGLTAEVTNLSIKDKQATEETIKIKPPVPARVKTTKSGGTILGGPPKPARTVGGARTPDIKRKKKDKKKD